VIGTKIYLNKMVKGVIPINGGTAPFSFGEKLGTIKSRKRARLNYAKEAITTN
jgi:hypothetical protein